MPCLAETTCSSHRTWVPCSHQMNREFVCIPEYSRGKCATNCLLVITESSNSDPKHTSKYHTRIKVLELPSPSLDLNLINIVYGNLFLKFRKFEKIKQEMITPKGSSFRLYQLLNHGCTWFTRCCAKIIYSFIFNHNHHKMMYMHILCLSKIDYIHIMSRRRNYEYIKVIND